MLVCDPGTSTIPWLASPATVLLSIHSSTTSSPWALGPLSIRIKLPALDKPKKHHKQYDPVQVLSLGISLHAFHLKDQKIKSGTQQALNKFHML